MAATTGWPAREGNGFDRSQFRIDWDAQTVICPQGKRSRAWDERVNPTGKAGQRQIQVRFQQRDCRACPCRAACTRREREPRSLSFLPRAEYEALQAARQRQATPTFPARDALRAGVESTLGQAVRGCDLRHRRYLGLTRTHLQPRIIAVAVNVLRLLAWLDEVPRATTRTSRWRPCSPACKYAATVSTFVEGLPAWRRVSCRAIVRRGAPPRAGPAGGMA